jgi:hypothetical protein
VQHHLLEAGGQVDDDLVGSGGDGGLAGDLPLGDRDAGPFANDVFEGVALKGAVDEEVAVGAGG